MSSCQLCGKPIENDQVFGNPGDVLCWTCWRDLLDEPESYPEIHCAMSHLWISNQKPAEWPAIPADVAVCPICRAPVEIVEINEWEVKSRKVTDDGLKIDCTTAPDIDSDGWEDWHRTHWSRPYVDWLPVEKKGRAWFNQHYRIR
jgi:hypothetical protein